MNDDYETRKLLLKQGEYRKLYSSLLQKHRGVLQTQPDEGGVPNANENTNAKDGVSSYKNSNHFEEEDRVLNQIFQTEVKNVAMGIGATAVALASLRFARSRHAASTVFGSAKAKVLQEAEIEGKRVGTDTFQKSFGTCHTVSYTYLHSGTSMCEFRLKKKLPYCIFNVWIEISFV